jgi:hypothetical protein
VRLNGLVYVIDWDSIMSNLNGLPVREREKQPSLLQSFVFSRT